MKQNPIFYDEAMDLLDRLSKIPYSDFARLLGFKSGYEVIDSLANLNKLLSAYVQLSDDLKELQEVSE